MGIAKVITQENVAEENAGTTVVMKNEIITETEKLAAMGIIPMEHIVRKVVIGAWSARIGVKMTTVLRELASL